MIDCRCDDVRIGNGTCVGHLGERESKLFTIATDLVRCMWLTTFPFVLGPGHAGWMFSFPRCRPYCQLLFCVSPVPLICSKILNGTIRWRTSVYQLWMHPNEDFLWFKDLPRAEPKGVSRNENSQGWLFYIIVRSKLCIQWIICCVKESKKTNGYKGNPFEPSMLGKFPCVTIDSNRIFWFWSSVLKDLCLELVWVRFDFLSL